MTPFELATRGLLALIAEALDDALGPDDRSMNLLALVQVRAEGLASNLAIDKGYPDLPDAPLRDVQQATDRIRARLAEIRCGCNDPAAACGNPDHKNPGGTP